MSTMTEKPEQGLVQLLDANREMNSTMADVKTLLTSLVTLMQQEKTKQPDLERGIVTREISAPEGYRLRAAPTSFKLGESDATGNIRSTTTPQDNGNDAIAELLRGLLQQSGPQNGRISRRATFRSEPSSSGTSPDRGAESHAEDDIDIVLTHNTPLSRRAMSFILKEKVPDIEEYIAHFEALGGADITAKSSEAAAPSTAAWKEAVVRGLNALAPSFTDEKNLIPVDLFDQFASKLMCSLFLSETTHPHFKKMSQLDFETVHAPRLYEFLESTMAPYAWRSDQVMSDFHPVEQHFSWGVALRLVSSIGVALRRAQHERTEEYDYYTTGADDRTGEAVRTRFELILENMCVNDGLLPADREGQGRYDWRVNLRHEATYWLAEKLRNDYLVNEPGLSRTPDISPNIKHYHGATYVTQPDPIPERNRNRYMPDTGVAIEQTPQMRVRADKLMSSATFEPSDLALDKILATWKGWSIVWTSSLDEHLWVQDFKIFVYWCPTALYHRPRGPQSLDMEELRKTYSLLFASTSKKLASQRQAIVKETDKYLLNGRPLKPFEKVTSRAMPINPLDKPYKGLLSSWLELPCPHHIAQVFGHDGARTTIVNNNIMINTSQSSLSRFHEMTIHDLLSTLKPGTLIPEDLALPLQSILLHPHESLSSDFTAYPYFGERLRHLNYTLQNQKPRSLTELWSDQRDSLQWWTFWLVVWVGIASVLLAMGSLAASFAQTWAAFHALDLN